jgi:hypothetical protein
VLATSLLMHEDEDTFARVFKAFSKAFGVDPVVAFTDSNIATAIALAWLETAHLLCSFHLFKNWLKRILVPYLYELLSTQY